MVDDDSLVNDEELQAQIDKARQAGDAVSESEPYALNAWYDSSARLIYVKLNNGIVTGFPTEFLQGLETATCEQLAAVEITPPGYGLHWEELDVDLNIPQLISGCYGTKKWMQNLDRASDLARPKESYMSSENLLKRNPTVHGQVLDQSTPIKITIEILKNTSLLTWITIPALFCGGLIFIVYFASIGYMPELDIQTAIYQIYTVALTGAFFLPGISICLVFPSLSYQFWVKQSPFKDRIKDDSFGFVRLTAAQVFLFIGFVAIFSALLSFFQSKNSDSNIFLIIGAILAGLFSLWIGIYLVNTIIINTGEKYRGIIFFRGWKNLLLWKSVFYDLINPIFLLVLFFSYLMNGTEFLNSISKDLVLVLAFLASVAIIVVIANKMAILFSPQRGLIRFLFLFGFGFAAFLLIQIIFSNVAFLPSRIVNIYGWGNVRNTTLVLNQDGCEIVRVLDLQVKLTNISSNQNKICQIEEVDILSRLGTKYYLKAKSSNNSIRTFEIPASMIYSWSTSKPIGDKNP